VLKQIRLRIKRVALTKADTRALGEGPRFPAFEKKDDPRYSWFVSNYGHWCWELDAMAPNTLRDRLERAIRAELDLEAWYRCVDVEEVERADITATCEVWNGIRKGIISGQDQK
jgi:hypothetical protein